MPPVIGLVFGGVCVGSCYRAAAAAAATADAAAATTLLLLLSDVVAHNPGVQTRKATLYLALGYK